MGPRLVFDDADIRRRCALEARLTSGEPGHDDAVILCGDWQPLTDADIASRAGCEIVLPRIADQVRPVVADTCGTT